MRRKKSKISIQFEEYENHKKEYDNLIKEELEEENDLIEINSEDSDNINDSNNRDNKDNNDNNCFNNIKQFEIYFFLKLNNDIEYVFPILSDYLNIKEKYGFELIKNIIQKINDKNIVVENNSVKYFLDVIICDIAPDDHQQALKMLQFLIGDAFCRKSVGKGLESRTDFKYLIDIPHGHGGHISPPAGHHNHIAFQLQLADSLAHGSAGYAQFFRQLYLHDPLPRLQDAVADCFTKWFADNFPQRLVAVKLDGR